MVLQSKVTKTPPSHLLQRCTRRGAAGFHLNPAASFVLYPYKNRSGGRCSGASAGFRRSGSKG